MDKFIIEGSEKRDYIVKSFAASGHLILPKSTIGKLVKVVFVDPVVSGIEEKEK